MTGREIEGLSMYRLADGILPPGMREKIAAHARRHPERYNVDSLLLSVLVGVYGRIIPWSQAKPQVARLLMAGACPVGTVRRK